MFVCIWEGIQIKDDTDLVVAHSTPNLNYAEDLAWLGVWWTGKAVRNLWLCCLVALSAQPRSVLLSHPLSFEVH